MGKSKKRKPFWELGLNPVTMWPRQTSSCFDQSLQYEVQKKDQASIFKPKGFR